MRWPAPQQKLRSPQPGNDVIRQAPPAAKVRVTNDHYSCKNVSNSNILQRQVVWRIINFPYCLGFRHGGDEIVET